MIEISVSGLKKSFEIGNNILDGLTFQIETGERVGLLGRNGAGKSTLFRILTGELEPDEGQVVLAKDSRLGLISQIPVYPAGYTVEDVLLTAFSRHRKLAEEMDGDEKTGAKIILKALESPLFHIVSNAGLEGSVVVNKVRESEVGVGFDAYKEEYVDMVKEGILDPAKVTRSALQNATSVASTLLTTESVVATIKEDTPAMPAGGAGGMGMM